MDVEGLAVSKITSTIARCPQLQAFISTNDKTPFTDGHIDLYNTPHQSKKSWSGRVPVQVKGRTLKFPKGTPPSFPIPRTDLLAYQQESGVLYFLVTIHPKSSALKAYYALLSPFSIEAMLRSTPPEQASITVPLQTLPNSPADIQRILWLALKTREQNPSLGFDPVLLNEVESFTLHTASELPVDAPINLVSGINDFALVLHTKGGLSIPVGGTFQIYPQEWPATRKRVRIACGRAAYEEATFTTSGDHDVEVHLSEGLRLLVRNVPGGQSISVSLTLEPTLDGRCKALQFYVELLDTGTIEIDGTPFHMDVKGDDDAWLRNHLHAIQRMTDLMAVLDVDPHLVDLNDIDEEHGRQLELLHRAFVDHEELKNPSIEPSRVIQRLGNWALMFLILPGAAPDSWRFIDPFTADARSQFMGSAAKDGQRAIPLTAYDVVENEHLGTVLNMHLDSIVAAYEPIADFDSTYELANERVIALIAASDTNELRRKELLAAAAQLNDWLVIKRGQTPRDLVNGWQISWRQKGLSSNERRAIRKLRREMSRSGASDAVQYELACALLLGEAEEVEELLEGFPPEQLDKFKGWPIWKLRSGGLAVTD